MNNENDAAIIIHWGHSFKIEQIKNYSIHFGFYYMHNSIIQIIGQFQHFKPNLNTYTYKKKIDATPNLNIFE